MILLISIRTTFICIALALMALFSIYQILKMYGKEQLACENEYDRVYAWMQKVIDKWDLTEQSYEYILRLFEQLKKLKYNDKEKTQVLYDSFTLKYSKIIEERKSEDEFSPEQVFKTN